MNYPDAERRGILSIKSEEGIKITKRALESIRTTMVHTKLKSKDDEILFFKQLKPLIKDCNRK